MDGPLRCSSDTNTDADGLCDDGRIYYLTDANANVTALTDASGNVIERYVYTPYGDVTIYDSTWSNTRGSSAYDNTILYTGRELDPQTGLYNYRARWYHAGLGTFTTRDPLGFSAGDANLYRYVGGNPISRTDPSGMLVVEPTGLLSGGYSECAYGAYDWSDPAGNWVAIPGSETPIYVPQYGLLLITIHTCNFEPSCDWFAFGYELFSPPYWYVGIPIHGHLNPDYSPGPGSWLDSLYGYTDTVTLDMTKYWRQWLGVDDVNYDSWWYRGGQIGGTGANLVLGFANPCQMGRLAGTGLRGINGLQFFGNSKNAIENAGEGNYGAAALDVLGALNNMRQFGRPCFAAGTPLLTPDGAKPIEQLKPGDMVLSSPEDDPDGPVQPRRVEEVFERSSVLFDVYIGGKLIRTTPEHPFYVQGKGWTAAKSLVSGDLLRSHDGQWVAVESACDSGEVAPVYNMRVVDDHTYFVGSADWGFSVWVHNTCRVVDLEPGVGKKPVGPELGPDDAIEAGLSGEDLIAGSQSEAADIARAIGGGKPPIKELNPVPHFHPFGREPNIHIWWQ